MKKGTDVDGYEIYLPESAINEAVNIREALKPLGFEILGFRNKYARLEYVLHLRFVGPVKDQPPVIASVGITDPGENTPPSM